MAGATSSLGKSQGRTINKTWHQSTEALNVEPIHVVRCIQPGWDPRDHRKQWLETLSNNAQSCSQLLRCIHSSSSLIFKVPKFHMKFSIILIISYFLPESYLLFLIFFVTTDTVTMSTALGFSLTFEPMWCGNLSRNIYVYNWLNYLASKPSLNFKKKINPIIIQSKSTRG